LLLDALRSAAQVADPGRSAIRAAGGDRRSPAAVVAAKGRAGLVVDERAFAVRTGLDVAAVPAEDDRRGAAAVDRQDRLVAGRAVHGRHRLDPPPRQQSAIARLQLLTEVDDLDHGPRASRAVRQDHPRVAALAAPGDP